MNGRSLIVFLLGAMLFSCRSDVVKTDSEYSGASDFSISLQQLTPEQTGIDFNNTLNDEGNLNVFIWNFLYTGAGVATGDINNDGLPDIYFAGNQVTDKLYVNKGNFRFEDVTPGSGIPEDRSWSTGVTMADINADGLLDIYVCKNSPTPNPDANRNKLYINLGNNKFSERAAEYGIADEGFSIQAMFFDADQDGDLDMYLVNQPFDQFARYIYPLDVVRAYPITDRFFNNEDGHFVDRTEEMHLQNDRYGLGISLGDFDDNGWTDIYLCNDYTQADFLYMNYNGAFRDEIRTRTGHISIASMGSDAGDVNNDGWEDVFVLDMAYPDHYRAKTNMQSMQPELFWEIVAQGHQYPYAQNTMQLNRGDGYFAEVGQISGLSKTDWSWATLLADLDQDGLQDVLVTNGISRDMKDNDFTMWVKLVYQGRVGPTNYREVLAHLPSNPVSNKIFRNIDGLRYHDITDEVGFGDIGFSHGLAYADFDGDGALDLVTNNMNAPAGIFRNNSNHRGNYFILTLEGQNQNKNGLGIPVVLFANGKPTGRTMQTTRGYYSSSIPELHFGIGEATVVDSVIVYWNAKEMTVLKELQMNQKLLVKYIDAHKELRRPRHSETVILESNLALPFVHHETPFDDYKDQILLPYKLSQNGPFIGKGDINGDGSVALYIGGAAGQAGALLVESKSGSYVTTEQPTLVAEAEYEDQESLFFDLEGDGDLDLYVVSGSNEFPEGDPRLEDRIYLNDGSGAFTRNRNALPDQLRINGQCVVGLDLEGDGDIDIFIGGRMVSGKYPIPATSAVLVNEKGVLRDRTNSVAPFLNNFGLVTDAVSDDIDGDGDLDLIVVGEWMAPELLINRDGKLSAQALEVPGVGLWWTVEKGDFDRDGDNDFILGNLGWNQNFGGENPTLEVYAGDFDLNGNHDVVLAKKVDEGELPYRGRECSAEEMPFIASKFPTYDAFAKADLSDILGQNRLNESYHANINTLSSVFLRNEGNRHFTSAALPEYVQTGPVKAISVVDINQDGNLDFVYMGNHFPAEVETARYDALMHGICVGDGNGGFQANVFSSAKSPLTGDYRDICVIGKPDGGYHLIVSQNDGPALLYALKSQ